MEHFDKHSSVYGDVNEMLTLEKEIKRLNKIMKNLRLQKKEVEGKICEFLQQNNQIGFKYNGIAVTIIEKKYRKRKTEAEKKDEILEIIESSRDFTSDKTLSNILDSVKGDEYIKNCIKLQKIKEEL